MNIAGYIFITILYSLILGLVFKVIGNVVTNAFYDVTFGYPFWFCMAILPVTLYVSFSSKCTKLRKRRDALESDLRTCEREIKILKENEDKTRARIHEILSSKEPFKHSGHVISSLEEWIFDDAANMLMSKQRPAMATANEIKYNLKQRTMDAELKSSCILLKYRFLTEHIPELKEFVEDEDKLMSIWKSSFQTKYETLEKRFNARFFELERQHEDRQRELQQQFTKRENEQRSKIDEEWRRIVAERTEISVKNNELKEKEKKLRELITTEYPIRYSATMQSDIVKVMFSELMSYLERERHALKSAEITKELRDKTAPIVREYKEMLYKYETLLTTFPELREYVDDERELHKLLSTANDNPEIDYSHGFDYDRSLLYLSKKEYDNLDNEEKFQLALDRWKKRSHGNQTIGWLYEMQIAYLLRQSGYAVVEYGIQKGLKDEGKDLIAQKESEILIIQCKNWSAKKHIHENTVCQTFGTSVEYELSKNEGALLKYNITPVLYTTAPLSEKAQKFAKKLGVCVSYVPFDINTIPLIKCNVNGSDKIYHLPFDQQYWRTIISNSNEYYVHTVREAESKGFRRALRHIK